MRGLIRQWILIDLILGYVLLVIASKSAVAQSVPFVPPPRTIADITAILDQEQPDPRVIAERVATADAAPPAGASAAELAEFYYDRGAARARLGRFREAIADAETAIENGKGQIGGARLLRMRNLMANQYAFAGDPKTSLQVLFAMALEAEQQSSARGFALLINRQIIERLITFGDLDRAGSYLEKSEALLRALRRSPAYAEQKSNWEGNVEIARAQFLEARGQFAEAEGSYRKAELWRRDVSARMAAGTMSNAPRGYGGLIIDDLIASQGRMKARQGRIAEGEADVRRALLGRLRGGGRYDMRVSHFIGMLANLLIEQGRFAEAEQLTRRQLRILQSVGVPPDAQNIAAVLGQLASILNLQGRWGDAARIYAELDEATKAWEPARKDSLILNASHITTLYQTGNLAGGVAAAERLLVRQRARYGDGHTETAFAHGLLAIGLVGAGRDGDALREFRLAIPILTATSRETDSDDAIDVAEREQRLQVVIESYMALLARGATVDRATESFRLADVVRGHAVQRAIAASSARAAARDPALMALARNAQDLEKQVAAQLGLLNNMLTLPQHQRDDNVIGVLQAEIDKVRMARDAAKRELAVKFPAYSGLVEPPLATVADIQSVLRPEEAFLSFYFGREASFVWVVPKSGPVAFAAIAATVSDIDSKVQALRLALEPNATTVGDIPPFDVALAHELYALLLEPVQAAWQPAKSLIVATNGALGLLPFGLLPTEPAAPDAVAKPYFAGYRNVPWLARTHAATLVPSAAALRTLRQSPPGSDQRERLIGFGDPIFSAAQAAALPPPAAAFEVASADTQGGMSLRRRAAPQTRRVDSAQLGLLPPLPDTADELKSVAIALQADPSKALHLGKAANEEVVKRTDLSKYRIIVFATHGLVPGDLDGLTQPALALSAPDVAGVGGDGLLTMEEILALKLDADWVVLSACNTGAAAGAGTEAASGLGRAFFYAGTRAILVTNWPVHSASARDLVTDLFRRQSADSKLSRGEALRQAMVALLDGKGSTDQRGETVFTYAHPLFWAPYTVIGDGG